MSLLLTLPLLGCGGRSFPLGGDGAPTGGDGGTVPLQDGAPPTPATDLGLPATGCIVAIRVDNCCTQPEPALVQHVAQDPCLVPYPYKTIPKACSDKWPEMCQYVDCAFGQPPTRVVKEVPGGGCAWADECADKSDCVLARDARQCCGCAEPYPRTLLQLDKCLVDLNTYPPAACAEECTAVLCEACPPPPSFECVQEQPYRVCRAVYEQ